MRSFGGSKTPWTILFCRSKLLRIECLSKLLIVKNLLKKKIANKIFSSFVHFFGTPILSCLKYFLVFLSYKVLEDFPSVQMPFDWLVQLVPPLKTRAFSISSSPLAHPNQVHLTVSVVSWTTPYKRKRTGLCSVWLAGLDPQQGMDTVK